MKKKLLSIFLCLAMAFSVVGMIVPTRAEAYMTCLGNPIVDESLFKKLRKMGIGAVRVPVTWVNHFEEDGSIDPTWMAIADVIRILCFASRSLVSMD